MNLLPGYEPSEADLVEQALAQPLTRKIELAIATLREYEAMALKLNERGYWLAYSGGKDSDVILELAKMAGVKYRAVYNVTTIDPPELVLYIKREHPATRSKAATRALALSVYALPSQRVGLSCGAHSFQIGAVVRASISARSPIGLGEWWGEGRGDGVPGRISVGGRKS